MNYQPQLRQPKKKRQYPETALQRAIVQILLLTRKPNVIYFAVPNGVKMAPRTAAHQKSIGMLAGVSDLVIDIGGRIHYLEVKAPGGKQSPDQLAFEAATIAQESPYMVVNNINDAIFVLEEWGAIRPRSKTRMTFQRTA